AEWDAVISVNLKGTFNCIQKVSRFMLNQKSGNIINIASVIGLMGNIGQSNYAASKGGIIALTKSTAKEFATRNIRANAIAPGFIETEMTAQLSAEVVENYAKAIPLQRMGKPVDVANACIFLASDEAAYITGQTLQVDGGLIMS
ncbi:MAG TPA: SDR family oxidoreductase, partial [Candidatus Cloacimonadota bacterium]|nr:SDR family oxidoreductase [Candidatus Cloacimonadota bacterium]